MTKYKKPVFRRTKGIAWTLKSLREGWKTVCRQCSGCHGCR